MRRLLSSVVLQSVLAILLIAPLASSASDSSVQEVELHEYQGVKLDPVTSFYEDSIIGAPEIDPETYRLLVDGLVASPLALTYQELQSMSHTAKLVTLQCVDGWSATALWEGIAVADLFASAAPSPGANTVIFYAADGYTTSLPLDVVMDRNLIIADRINGIVLPAPNGFPFQLVAEDEWGDKWIRWITEIKLSRT